ncbi:aspartate aminotransferase family protein [Niveispirillum sp. SYP-B3756]|uniref:(R)-1-hydroxy-2-aminoethylphosphonate ammonia-lyase n=1 Tax=Niveispirillum sp. SYP-B3756 TaxID=2662178 RepID=UPI0032B3B7C5
MQSSRSPALVVPDAITEGDINKGSRRAAWTAALGPTARQAVARDGAVFLRQSLSTPCLSAVRKAEGIWIEDMDGRRIMDFHGNSVHHIGYGHPRLKAALARQMDELPFAPRRFTCDPAMELAEKLSALAPWPGGAKVLFAPGGSEAVEMALKLARIATGRFKTVSFWDAFHGAGLGASSLGGEQLFRGHGPLLTGTEHVAPFACYRCPYGFPGRGVPDLSRCAMACATITEYTLDKQGDVAALVAEPMRAVPTIAPAGFWPRMRNACDRQGSLMIFDEITTGLGKTGSFFAHAHEDTLPDMLVLGKALGGGMLPLAALLVRPDLDVADAIAIGHYTHEKNPLLARAGLTTLQIIEEEGLVDNAARLGAYAMERLMEMRQRHPIIGDVRGRGLLIGVELTRTDGSPALDAAEEMLYRCLTAGLSFKLTMGSVLTLSPPLTLTRVDLDQALSILEECLAGLDCYHTNPPKG